MMKSRKEFQEFLASAASMSGCDHKTDAYHLLIEVAGHTELIRISHMGDNEIGLWGDVTGEVVLFPWTAIQSVIFEPLE